MLLNLANHVGHVVFLPRRSKYSKAKQDADEEKHLHQGRPLTVLILRWYQRSLMSDTEKRASEKMTPLVNRVIKNSYVCNESVDEMCIPKVLPYNIYHSILQSKPIDKINTFILF